MPSTPFAGHALFPHHSPPSSEATGEVKPPATVTVMRCCCGYKILPGREDFQGRENLTMPSNSCGLFGATGTQLLSSALRRNNCVHGGLRDGRIGQKNEEVAHSQSLHTATDLPALLAPVSTYKKLRWTIRCNRHGAAQHCTAAQ